MTLTKRQREILLLAAGGYTNEEMSGMLGITTHVVKFHLMNAHRRLKATTRIAAIMAALRAKIIDIDEIIRRDTTPCPSCGRPE